EGLLRGLLRRRLLVGVEDDAEGRPHVRLAEFVALECRLIGPAEQGGAQQQERPAAEKRFAHGLARPVPVKPTGNLWRITYEALAATPPRVVCFFRRRGGRGLPARRRRARAGQGEAPRHR